ncbi:MAG: FAD-dependent oxidoreductase [Acidimicrobiales bacterium]
MGSPGRRSVAVLGGGMGALVTAFELSEGHWADRFDRITVYQRGWRLGGKGASSRGIHGRIEEHGLHVLLGYYDHTFDVMRRCYEELDRTHSDPRCPITSWEDSVAPSNLAGVMDPAGEGWDPWVATFSATSGRPGGPTGDSVGSSPLPPAELALRSLQLLLDFFASLPGPSARREGAVRLSVSPVPPAPEWSREVGKAQISTIVRGAALIGVALPLSWAQRAAELARSRPIVPELMQAIPAVVEPLRKEIRRAVLSDKRARRTYHLIELVTANLVGIASDGLLSRPGGFAAIDHLDYRAWLLKHGIDPDALESPLLRGMYDLVFAYEGADPARPRFSAGLGLQLATKMLMGYSGALFWRMQAGMGEVIVAPLYQVLKNRGVEFCFFHRVDALRLSDDGRDIASIELGVQAEVTAGIREYDPLIRVKELPCWPSAPLLAQLRDPGTVEGLDLESFWSPRRDAGRRTLRAGTDFDVVVFGISLGMVRFVCADLVDHDPAWRSMVDKLGTVATQSLQLWLNEDERALGWPGPDGVTVSGFAKPFDTWASMTHLLPVEAWTGEGAPRALAYFCGALAPPDPSARAVDGRLASAAVGERARAFLDTEVAGLWPAAVDDDGFRWELLHGATTPGPERLTDQYWRANIDPSDLYVQSLPATDQYRMKPGCTGFGNLAVAGDWTDSGLNAGCVEAATRSGRLAARAVEKGLHASRVSEGSSNGR